MTENQRVDLRDKVVVITGGSGVLCRTMAKALAGCGAKVALISLHQERAEEVAEEIRQAGGTALGIGANVLDEEALEKAAEQIHEQLGLCDILLNGAGGNNPGATTDREFMEFEKFQSGTEKTFFDLDTKSFNYVFDLNFMGTLVPTKIFCRDMMVRKRGCVVNVSSMSAYRPMTKVPAYSAAKAGISNFTQWLAVNLAHVNIRVNALAPGFFLTKQNHDLLIQSNGELTSRGDKIITHTPMGRLGRPEDLLGPLFFLVDDKASGFVNGIVLNVDGGFMAYAGV